MKLMTFASDSRPLNNSDLKPESERVLMYHGKPVPFTVQHTKYGTSMRNYELDKLQYPSQAIIVTVLKRDNKGIPIWWCEGGINWCWYGATTYDEACKLHAAITFKSLDSYNGIIIKDGSGSYWMFRLHR